MGVNDAVSIELVAGLAVSVSLAVSLLMQYRRFQEIDNIAQALGDQLVDAHEIVDELLAERAELLAETERLRETLNRKVAIPTNHDSTNHNAWYEYRPDGHHICLGCGQPHDGSRPAYQPNQHKENCWVQHKLAELAKGTRAKAGASQYATTHKKGNTKT